jgi:hypothetical protein
MSGFKILESSRAHFVRAFILKILRNFGERLQNSSTLPTEEGLRIHNIANIFYDEVYSVLSIG